MKQVIRSETVIAAIAPPSYNSALRIPLGISGKATDMFSERIFDRMDAIEPLVRDGDVLDLGIVNARPERENSSTRVQRMPDALFCRIVQVNPNVLGIDIDSEGVEALREQGYNVACANVETMDVGRQFDTIVAGELIEHLENPGLFLRNIRRHLKPEGHLVLTTPNPFYKVQTWKIWRYGSPAVHEDHVGWQDPATVKHLLERTGYRLANGYWIQRKRKFLRAWAQVFRPYFSHSFLVVAQPTVTATESRAA